MFTQRFNQPVSVMQFGRDVDRMLRQAWENLPAEFGGPTRAFPALNVWEDEQNLYAEAELPGLRMEDLELFVTGNELTVKGSRRPAAENVTYHRRERGLGTFHRTLRLPVDVEADKVEATLRDGVLTITLPKAEAARPKKIPVRFNGK